METKVKYDALTHEGKRVKITKKYIVPDYEEIVSEFLGRRVVTTVESQIDEYISDLDKAEFMEENDLHLIFDWKIISAKKESKELVVSKKAPNKDKQVKMFIEVWEMDEKIKLDFLAVYLKMKPSLKGLSIEKIVEVVISSMGASYQAVGAAFDRIESDMEEWRKENNIKDFLHLHCAYLLY